MTVDAAPSQLSALDRYFKVSERGSTVERELRGGLTTFFTMAYIVVLNPLIIGTVKDADGHLLGVPRVAAISSCSVTPNAFSTRPPCLMLPASWIGSVPRDRPMPKSR